MGQKWKYQPPTYKQIEEADRLSEELDMSPILCGLLVTRGITTVAEAKQFFRPRLSNLHNPFLMNDMDIAVKRLNQALGRKERILVYGDYDVDGTTAVALVYKFLQQFSSNIDYYIPDRKEDGYGISHRGVGMNCADYQLALIKSAILGQIRSYRFKQLMACGNKVAAYKNHMSAAALKC